MTRLKERRVELGLTQEQLAFRAGVSKATIQNLENGKPARLDSAKALARVLESTVDDLFPDPVAS